MAITITATLDASGVKTGSAQAGASLDGLANKAENSTEKLDQVAEELLSDLSQLKGECNKLQAELSEMGNAGAASFDEMGDAADDAGARMKSADPGKLRQGITAVATSYLAVVSAVEKVAQFAEKANQAIMAMADDGNPAAIKLAGSITKMKEELFAIAEDPLFQEMFVEIANVVNEHVVPAIAKIPNAYYAVSDAVQDAHNHTDSFFGSMMDWVRLIAPMLETLSTAVNLVQGDTTEYTAEQLQQMRKVRDEARAVASEAAQNARAIRKEKERRAETEMELARIEDGKREEEMKTALDQIDSEEQIRKAIEDEVKWVRELDRAGKLTAENRKRSIQGIEQAEARLATIRANNAKAAQEAEDVATQAIDKATEEKGRIQAEYEKVRDQHAADELDRQSKVHQASLDMERRAIDERKRLLGGKDVGGAEQLLKAQDPEMVRQAVANRRGFEAGQKARQELDPKFADDAAGKRRLEQAVAKERQKAVALAKRQFDQGQFNPDEIRQAQSALASQAADAAVAQGKATKETAAAVKESLAELARTQGELESIQGEMAGMRKLMQAVTLQGQRRRAQNAGARQ